MAGGVACGSPLVAVRSVGHGNDHLRRDEIYARNALLPERDAVAHEAQMRARAKQAALRNKQRDEARRHEKERQLAALDAPHNPKAPHAKPKRSASGDRITYFPTTSESVPVPAHAASHGRLTAAELSSSALDARSQMMVEAEAQKYLSAVHSRARAVVAARAERDRVVREQEVWMRSYDA